MAFKYACFVSYCHGQHELVKSFIDQLKEALNAELDTLLDEEVYVDEERLAPGYRYNEALAKAICQSVCMIVVYTPRYERHEYCVREFEAMELLEKRRRERLGSLLEDAKGFIIPIVFRGDNDLPPRIRQRLHFADFSRFTLATPEIKRNPEYLDEIGQIARLINEQYQVFVRAGADPCTECHQFELPPASALVPWRPIFVNR
jgi:hypothetical protein